MPQIERPRNLGDLMKFVADHGLGQEEYFAAESKLSSEEPLWKEDTRWIAVFWVEGGSEGYYVHVERLNINKELGGELVAQNLALGKYWSKGSASIAVTLLTPFVYGLYPV